MAQRSWIGQELGGRYRIDLELGHGGMSSVYRATDDTLSRVVAIKLIHFHLSRDSEFIRRFSAEAKTLAQLRHPHIVQVYDLRQEGDTFYIVLEFVPGQTLQARLQRLNETNKRMSLAELYQVAANIGEAMRYAHERDVVHRDIKPANVMINVHGEAILTDFGIVKIVGGTQHTATGAVLGTARYMSPEQIKGERVDARSDIYSFGVMLYEMIGGRPPYDSDSVMSLMMMHINEPVPDVRQVRPDAPTGLVAIIQKAMAKEVGGRYQSMGELLADLRRVQAGGSPAAAGTTRRAPARPAQRDVNLTELIESEMGYVDPVAQLRARPAAPPAAAAPTPMASPAKQGRRTMVAASVVALLAVIAGLYLIFGLSGDGDDRQPTTVARAGDASPPTTAAAELPATGAGAAPLPAPATPGLAPTATERAEPTATVPQPTSTLAPPAATAVPQGGTLVYSSLTEPDNLNPILLTDRAALAITDNLYLGLVQADPFTGEIKGDLATSWTISPDGMEFTFILDQDAIWSDGTPLTAHDVKFTLDAANAESVESTLNFREGLVKGITAIDDFTLSVSLNRVDCGILEPLRVGVLPAHKFAADYSDFSSSTENHAPSVVSGPFIFREWRSGEELSLVANPDYFRGAPNIDALVYRFILDEPAALAAVLDGEVDVTSVDAASVAAVEAAIARGDPLQMATYPEDSYAYLSFNLADPGNPQPGWIDADGNGQFDEGEARLPNDPHPILSDPRVRLAISYAVDIDNIINNLLSGQAIPAAANVAPSIEWAFDSRIRPTVFDTAAAQKLLDEAGWVMGANGIRSKNGVPLSLRLSTTDYNEIRVKIAQVSWEILTALGFDVELELYGAVDLIGELFGQTYDMVVLGWGSSGPDPDDSEAWTYAGDDPGSGYNFGSYYNQTVEDKLNQARALPGCSTEVRGELYREVQRLLHDDAPFAFLYVPLTNIVWNSRVVGIDPGPWSLFHNVEEWYVTP